MAPPSSKLAPANSVRMINLALFNAHGISNGGSVAHPRLQVHVAALTQQGAAHLLIAGMSTQTANTNAVGQLSTRPLATRQGAVHCYGRSASMHPAHPKEQQHTHTEHRGENRDTMMTPPG